jgi:hypothetical protein
MAIVKVFGKVRKTEKNRSPGNTDNPHSLAGASPVEVFKPAAKLPSL